MNNAYLKVQIEQRTPAWDALRLKHFTASNAAIIRDLHPYKTRLEYFEEKISGKEKAVTGPQLERGHLVEEHGRQLITADFGIDLDPAVVVSKRVPDLLASLDGFNESEKIIFESKYVGKEVFDQIAERKIPIHHQWQVQAQLLATGAERCIYYTEDSTGRKLSQSLMPQAEYIDALVEEIASFMAMVKNGEYPEPGDRDFVQVDDPDLAALRNLKQLSDESAKNYDAMKKVLDEKYKDKNRIKGNGMMMYRALVKASIPYSKIAEVMAMDLEKHRPKPRFQTTFKILKEKA
jgi:putative phage-type endonuclease